MLTQKDRKPAHKERMAKRRAKQLARTPNCTTKALWKAARSKNADPAYHKPNVLKHLRKGA
jgi:hypothetical protein